MKFIRFLEKYFTLDVVFIALSCLCLLLYVFTWCLDFYRLCSISVLLAIYYGLPCKSSAEADKNKNENKE